jgi:hypothetical protein
MTGKSDVANLAGLLCGLDRFHRSTFGENAIWIFHPDDFVELHEVDAIRSAAVAGTRRLWGRGFLRAEFSNSLQVQARPAVTFAWRFDFRFVVRAAACLRGVTE